MQNFEITISNKLGLHSRAAAKLVHTAARFASSIKIIFGSKSADCKSIMSVITLGARFGSQLLITVEGTDEEDAAQAIKDLFANKFGESE